MVWKARVVQDHISCQGRRTPPKQYDMQGTRSDKKEEERGEDQVEIGGC